MKNTKINRILIIGLFAIMLFPLISAGATSMYYSENPLHVAPGAQMDFEFVKLQNIGGGRNITYQAEMLEGNEIATITDSSLEYLVPLDEKNIPVNLKLNIPADAPEGTTYTLSIRFVDITPPEGEGMVTFTKAFTWTTPVVVEIPEAEPEISIIDEETGEGLSLWLIILLIAIIVIIVIIIVIIIIKKRKSKGFAGSTSMPNKKSPPTRPPKSPPKKTSMITSMKSTPKTIIPTTPLKKISKVNPFKISPTKTSSAKIVPVDSLK